MNGEDRNATPAPGGGRRRSAAAVPLRAHRGRSAPSAGVTRTYVSLDITLLLQQFAFPTLLQNNLFYVVPNLTLFYFINILIFYI